MDAIEWAKTCTSDEFIAEILTRLDETNYEDGVKMLQALMQRCDEGDKFLEMAMMVYMNSPEALHATHRPEMRERGQAALGEAWAKAKP